MAKRYAFEDFYENQEIIWGEKTMEREEIIEFAREFDPAPFHLDDAAAAATPLGKISASGFHTCGIAMRLMCEAFVLNSTSQGAFGVDECRWHKPVFPGDTLSGKTTILKTRLSNSKPGLGFADCIHAASNQNGEPVVTIKNTGMFLTRQRYDELYGGMK